MEPGEEALQFDESRYADIIGPRANRYLRRFRRISNGGWFSWNWAAFFGTFVWLRYRRLYGWSWVYAVVSMPVIFGLLILRGGGDACGAALDPAGRETTKTMLIGLLALCWIVPPLIADHLYYARVRRLAAAGPADAGRGGRFAVSGAFLLQALLFVVVAVFLPSTLRQNHRARVTEAVLRTAEVKEALSEYVRKYRRVPERLEQIVLLMNSPTRRLELGENGALRVVFNPSASLLAGHSILMTPEWKTREIVKWKCSSDLPNQCLPRYCWTPPE